MTDKKEKEQKKKVTPGMAATAHRLETSHAVLSALKEAGSNSGAQTVSLASAARAALGLLKVVQDSEEDVDEDLVDLVIDTCGLVYIIIDASGVDDHHRGTAASTDLSSLTEAIDNFRVFCMKKIHGSFYRKIKKRGEDEKLMDGYRDHLRGWLVFFGGQESSSVHDYLEDVISRKLRPQIKEPNTNVHPPQPQRRPPISLSGSYAQKPVPPAPIYPIPSVQIQFPSPNTASPASTALSPGPGPAYPAPITFPSSPKLQSNFDAAESDPRTRRRLADELRKQEERARWRRSEELYNSLPPASPEDSTSQTESSLDAIAAHMKQSQSMSMILPQPKPQAKLASPGTSVVGSSRPASPRPPPAVTGAVLRPPTEEELAAARARQVEEDRVTALLLAGELQLEMEAAEKERAKRKASKKQQKDKHRPPAIGDPDTSSGYGYTSGDSAAIPIPVHVESQTTPAASSSLRTPPFRSGSGSLSQSNSLSAPASGSRPASPKMPRPMRSPSPLNQEALAAAYSPQASAFGGSSSSNELRPPVSASASASRGRDLPSSYVIGPRRSSDAVRPLPSPLQQKFSAEDIASDAGRGIYISNVSKSGISFGSGSVDVRNLGN